MADYWSSNDWNSLFGQGRGGVAMGLECPHCGDQDKHPVKKTDPQNYHWSDKHAEIFKKHAGRDICFRIRTRKCVDCGKEFDTTEFPYVFLIALMKELDQREFALDLFRKNIG